MITIRKAKEHHLSLVAHSSKDTLREPNTIKEELKSPHWLAAMQEKSMLYTLTRLGYWFPSLLV